MLGKDFRKEILVRLGGKKRRFDQLNVVGGLQLIRKTNKQILYLYQMYEGMYWENMYPKVKSL